MNKKEFLKELKHNISVLEDSEINDIVSEYEQHINMKVESGLSEEEAIADFGDIKEFCEEILKAYHVKGRADKADSAAGEALRRTGEFTKKAAERSEGIIKRAFIKLKAAALAAGKMALKPFKALGSFAQRKKESKPCKGEDGAYKGGIMRSFFGLIKALLRACVLICLFCIRWAWNGACIFVGLISSVFTLFALFCLGMLAVLLVKGYPVIGLSLISLGATLFSGAFAALCFFLMIFKGRNREEAQGERPEYNGGASGKRAAYIKDDERDENTKEPLNRQREEVTE